MYYVDNGLKNTRTITRQRDNGEQDEIIISIYNNFNNTIYIYHTKTYIKNMYSHKKN